jgi:hypothetical protein
MTAGNKKYGIHNERRPSTVQKADQWQRFKHICDNELIKKKHTVSTTAFASVVSIRSIYILSKHPMCIEAQNLA